MKNRLKSMAMILTLWAATVAAGQFDTAVDVYKSGDLSRAYGLFHRLAERENGLAQLNVATMTAKGDGIIQNDKDALFWAWRARFAGASQAIPTLRYLITRTTPEDQTAVAQDLRFTYGDQFDQGDVRAALKMGCTLNKVYHPRDVHGAYVWFTIAAALDVTYAKALRETISKELDVPARAIAQDEATMRLSQWCLRQTEKPMVCGNIFAKLGS